MTHQRSIALSPSGKAKRNQCHGTTKDGKRCTRIVGGTAANKQTSTPTKAKSPAGPRQALTVSALRQLDRRLSLGKGQRPRYSPNKGKGKHLSNAEEDEDLESPLSRIEENDGDSDEYEELEVYCFQHAKQILEQRFIMLGGSFQVDFDGKPDLMSAT